MWAVVKAWFQFTRSERVGVMVLVVLIFVIFMLPRFFPSGPVELTVEELSYISDSAKRSEVTKSDSAYGKTEWNEHSAMSFYFDPNTLSEDGWKRLGLRDRTVSTIIKFRRRGGRFVVPEDLGKVYGLRKHELDRLLPFVRIANVKVENKASANIDRVGHSEERKPQPQTLIDVNKADSALFESLPGIGAVLASRIVRYRDRLGGFYSIDQVMETYGVTDTLMRNIKKRLYLEPGTHRLIDLNTADADLLKVHPYVKWKLASLIINYRNQHGSYPTVDAIRSLPGLNDTTYQKLRPYLTVSAQ